MVAIAQRRVPEAEFRVGSLFESNVPTCDAFISIGEIFNCQLIQGMTNRRCSTLPPRIRCPDSRRRLRVRYSGASTGHAGCREQVVIRRRGWSVLVEKEENRERVTLTRRITSCRKVSDLYNRADEVHRLRLYLSTYIAVELRQMGFEFERLCGYGLCTTCRGLTRR